MILQTFSGGFWGKVERMTSADGIHNTINRVDWLLLFFLVILTFFNLTNMSSAGRLVFVKQAIFYATGYALVWVLSTLGRKWIFRSSYPLSIGSVLLLILTLLVTIQIVAKLSLFSGV